MNSIDDASFQASLTGPLRRLDKRLSAALAEADEAGGFADARDDDAGDLLLALHDPPAFPRFALSLDGLPASFTAGTEGRPGRVRNVFGLSDFALDLILIALAPEIDRRYERIYARLQRDPSSRRPTVDLALDLLCGNAEEKRRARRHFDPNELLLRQGLLRLEAEPGAFAPTRLGHSIIPGEFLVAFLIGSDTLPAALTGVCTRSQPEQRETELKIDPSGLPQVNTIARREDGPIRVVLRGDAASAVAAHIAAVEGKPLLSVILPAANARDVAMAALPWAALHDEVLCVAFAPDVAEQDRAAVLAAVPGAARGNLVLCGDEQWPAVDVLAEFETIDLPAPDYIVRLRCWERELGIAGLDARPDTAAILASRFRGGPDAIQAACRMARLDTTRAPFPALLRAVKSGRGRLLAESARRVEATQDWDDLILPTDQMRQLRDLCDQVSHRHKVEEEWGFAAKTALGRGICALFSGPSGTGKTMAAGIVARALHLDLYRIDLARVVSKFIGETEKNLDRVFTAAADADAVLFFDEADTLFGKRTEVKDAHDRYANLEVGYLLQKMEEYDGLAILATNLRQHLDDAFTRRLRAIVEFPFPDEFHRHRIWRTVFPGQAPLAEDVDLAWLAREIRVAGGNIRNIALSAAFLAAAEGGIIGHQHLVAAARAEYGKTGRIWQPGMD